MANVRLVWKPNALHDIRTSAEAAAMVNAVLRNWAEQANSIGRGEYRFESHQGRKAPQGRWRGTVYTADWRAMRDNARNNTLLRVVGGG